MPGINVSLVRRSEQFTPAPGPGPELADLA